MFEKMKNIHRKVGRKVTFALEFIFFERILTLMFVYEFSVTQQHRMNVHVTREVSGSREKNLKIKPH